MGSKGFRVISIISFTGKKKGMESCDQVQATQATQAESQLFLWSQLGERMRVDCCLKPVTDEKSPVYVCHPSKCFSSRIIAPFRLMLVLWRSENKKE